MPNDEPLDPIPASASGDDLDTLTDARQAAQDALEEARRLRHEATRAQRRARSRVQRYQELVAEYNGQLTIFDQEGTDDRP